MPYERTNDQNNRIVLTSDHGVHQCNEAQLHYAIAHYLPASITQLRNRVNEFTGEEGYADDLGLGGCLVVLASYNETFA